MYSNLLDSIGLIKKTDLAVGEAMAKELMRQQRNIELIASENFVSPEVMAAAGSALTNKYAEGYPNRRYYGGCQYVDIVEQLAIDRAKKLFNCEFANVQPHSGSQANHAVYAALLEQGDTVLGMSLDHGGHLTHGSPVNFSGQGYNIISYGITPDTHLIDYDQVLELAKKHKPKMIIAGASAYPREIDFAKFGEIAKETGAYLMVDMAHIAGLVAAGVHNSPIPHADVVTTTTHKTLRGTRGGLILTNDPALAKKIDSAVFPGQQGGPLMHIIAAKAVGFAEALRPEFKTYQENIVKNARALAKGMLDEGFTLVSNGTDNHMILVDLTSKDITGKDMENMMDEVHITCNKNSIPNEPRSPFITSGIRLGTPACTTRGMNEEDMKLVAQCIGMVASDFEGNKDTIIEIVDSICSRYPLYE